MLTQSATEEESVQKVQETEQRIREEAEQKVKEEQERKSKEEAERKLKEDADRKAKEEAEQREREARQAELSRIRNERKEQEARKAKEKAESEAKVKEAEAKAKEESERKEIEEARRIREQFVEDERRAVEDCKREIKDFEERLEERIKEAKQRSNDKLYSLRNVLQWNSSYMKNLREKIETAVEDQDDKTSEDYAEYLLEHIKDNTFYDGTCEFFGEKMNEQETFVLTNALGFLLHNTDAYGNFKGQKLFDFSGVRHKMEEDAEAEVLKELDELKSHLRLCETMLELNSDIDPNSTFSGFTF